ncbi:MAG: single-stranded-DNA-specific exonuclease RecJ [Pseudomonadota bacterium]|mgnify:CR=1 FL=1
MLNYPIIQSSNNLLSATNRLWQLREVDERLVAAIVREHDLPEIIARVLVARGIAIDSVEDFLNPTLRNFLPDPSHLLDMDKAAKRVADAVTSKEKIAIFGDYDVDGATSSALLARYFRALDISPILYIPDRMKEGYGPNEAALRSLHVQGVSLVITVDCGTLAFEPLAAARVMGMDVIVVDHHIGEARKPEALAIINPNRLDETSQHRQMAAVGVAFLLLVAVNRELRGRGFFAGRSEPDIKQWLDIVALGTVCDVVPLTGVNRALVAQGLKIMAGRRNIGISTVLDMARSDEKPNAYSCGFIIGPRINAGGRVGKSDLGVRLLATEDAQEAISLATELEQYNAERKTIESMVLEQAMEQAEKMDGESALLVIAGQGWHAGVIGIVAGRIKERFNKPVAVIAVVDGIGKASARSISGVDFGAAVIASMEEGLLIAGGGHAMAAGFTVEEEKITALSSFLQTRMQSQLQLLNGQRRLMLDGMVSISGASVELLEQLEKLAPFGQGNPQLRLCIKQVVNLKSEIVGEHHVKTLLIDKISNTRLSAISFRCVGTDLGDSLLGTIGKTIDVAGQLRLQEWNGKQTVSLNIEDIKI